MHTKNDKQKKMENQPAGEDHRDEREESYVLYNPCKLIDQLMKAFLKCLGFHVDDSSSACPKSDTQQHLDDPSPADNNESTEDGEYREQGIRSTRTLRRRPSGPPVTRGPPGGQINVVSPA